MGLGNRHGQTEPIISLTADLFPQEDENRNHKRPRFDRTQCAKRAEIFGPIQQHVYSSARCSFSLARELLRA